MVTTHPSIPTIFHASPISKNWDPKQAPSAHVRAIRIHGMSNLERQRFHMGLVVFMDENFRKMFFSKVTTIVMILWNHGKLQENVEVFSHSWCHDSLISWSYRKIPQDVKKESQWHIYGPKSENTGAKSSGFSSFSMLKWPQNEVFQVWRSQGLPVAVAVGDLQMPTAFQLLCFSDSINFDVPGEVAVKSLICPGLTGLTPIQQPKPPTLHPGRQSWRRPETTSSRRAASPASAALRHAVLWHPFASVSIDLVDHPYRSVTEYTYLLINTLINLLICLMKNM